MKNVVITLRKLLENSSNQTIKKHVIAKGHLYSRWPFFYDFIFCIGLIVPKASSSAVDTSN